MATITAKELILTGTGGSQKVQAFHASGAKAGTRFYAYAKTFTGGVTVATGDLDGNGIEIITGPAAGRANYPDPRVNLYKFANGSVVFTTSRLAYTNGFIGGIWVAKNAPWILSD